MMRNLMSGNLEAVTYTRLFYRIVERHGSEAELLSSMLQGNTGSTQLGPFNNVENGILNVEKRITSLCDVLECIRIHRKKPKKLAQAEGRTNDPYMSSLKTDMFDISVNNREEVPLLDMGDHSDAIADGILKTHSAFDTASGAENAPKKAEDSDNALTGTLNCDDLLDFCFKTTPAAEQAGNIDTVEDTKKYVCLGNYNMNEDQSNDTVDLFSNDAMYMFSNDRVGIVFNNAANIRSNDGNICLERYQTYTKVHITDYLHKVDSIMEETVVLSHDMPLVHKDSIDAFSLWIPVTHMDEELLRFKDDEIHIKLVQKSDHLNNDIEETRSQEIDDIISNQTVHDVNSESVPPSLGSPISSQNDNENHKNVNVHISKDKVKGDDFSSLLDDVFTESSCQYIEDTLKNKQIYKSSLLPNDYETSIAGVECGLTEEIRSWAYTPSGDIKDIRTLLYTLKQVLWPDSRWMPIDISVCADNPDVIRKHYLKALLICHPDKHTKSEPEISMRAQKVTQILQEAWAKMDTSA